MENNELIKYEGGLIRRVSNAISVTNKLLASIEPQLIPYRKKDKWGFCTPDKKIVINCVYDSADFFSEEYSSVCLNDKHGYINKKGIIVIDLEYDYAGPFINNLAVIQSSRKQGVINKNNQMVIESKFDEIYFRRDNYIHIKDGSNVGILDINLNEIIPPKYEEIGIFSNEGISSFRTKDSYGYGYLDKKGDVLISPEFDYAEEFKDGVAVVKSEGKYFLIYLIGKKITDNFKHLQSPFIGEENLYACSKDDLHFGFIDNLGNEIIPFSYDYVENFSEGLSCVYKDGKAGYIDKNNTIIIDTKFSKVHDFSEGLARVEKNGKQGFINRDGTDIIPFIYDPSSFITCFENGYVEVVSKNKCGIIDKSGKIVIPLEYTSVFYDSEFDIFLVSENNSKLQFISKKGLKYWED